MPELEQLHAGHAPAVLAFELANRAYFAASVSDRGDDFFAQLTDRHSALLAEQEAGICAFYVLVADDGSVLGRFNLYDIEDGTARLGYRVAQQVAGRGVATTSVRELRDGGRWLVCSAPSPAAAGRGGRDRPGRGPAGRRGRRAGRGARAGHLRVGCRGRGGPPAGRGAAGPAAGGVAGPGGGGVRGGPGHHLAVGPGGGLGRGSRAGPGPPRAEGRLEADAWAGGPGRRAGRRREDAAADRGGDRGVDVHRPGRAGPGPAGRPGPGGRRRWHRPGQRATTAPGTCRRCTSRG